MLKSSFKRIGINLLFLFPGKVGGTEIFARKLLEIVDKTFAKENLVVVYCQKEFANTVNYQNIKISVCPIFFSNKMSRLFYELLILPFVLLRDKIDLLHSMGYTSPIITNCPKIVTIFDTQYISFPNTISKFYRTIYLILIPLIAKTCDKIITVSTFSKNEIIKNLKVDPGKIQVIYGGVSQIVNKPVSDLDRGNYIMTSAATHPHKNILNLVKAFNTLITDEKFKKFKLIISGFPSIGQNDITNFLIKNKLTNQVKFLGWLDHSKNLEKMSKARLFVFPSLYEGFGLPALESLSLGTPLVVSNSASLPEVVGNSAVIINAQKSRNILLGIKKVLTNQILRNNNVKNGLQRAKLFGWKKSADKTIVLYKSFLNYGQLS
ncbi:MAG: glycosyltransferase family 1 protein [Candidatus Shapirobacteria bacterium]|jgi:glycosyltransferase involved in cell wall biosynthesis